MGATDDDNSRQAKMCPRFRCRRGHATTRDYSAAKKVITEEKKLWPLMSDDDFKAFVRDFDNSKLHSFLPTLAMDPRGTRLVQERLQEVV